MFDAIGPFSIGAIAIDPQDPDRIYVGTGEANASGSEWRTPPLWNIGLTAGVSGGEAYLHDGRARTLEEAILWHGGEADASANAFLGMSAADRAAF